MQGWPVDKSCESKHSETVSISKTTRYIDKRAKFTNARKIFITNLLGRCTYLDTLPLLTAARFSAGACGGANRRLPTGGAAYRMFEKL
jgi:hypothetical protein